jgi:phospholipase/carboxylesterase
MAGLRTVAIGPDDAKRVVVFLHGRMMEAADLAPFAHSLAVPALFLFPDAPLGAEPRGFSWWPTAAEARAQALAGRAPDLHAFDPPGRAQAREHLRAFCATIDADRTLVLVGFSQGGMLAMDYVLHGGRVDRLVLLSSSRIAYADWQPRLRALKNLPMLIAHGREDTELGFAAGEGLRDAALAGGAKLDWLPYDGGHEIPLVVWRALRRFLRLH